jgi:hypothetical protein
MNSMLRQSHIREFDLNNFLRNYDSSNTTAVSLWTKAACSDLESGSLVFIVEPVTLPFGLISFSRKDDEDNFRVTDFAIVVRIEDGKAMVINLSHNTYELRFLEPLIEERAKKAIIDRKRFSFVCAKPKTTLTLTKFQELERLSNLYAKGGSRRTLMTANAQEEPAIALLAACGAHIHFTNINKQPIEVGVICHSLFNTDTKFPDTNRSELKDNFVPLPSDFSEPKPIPVPPIGFETQGKHIDLLFEKPAGKKAESGQDNTGFNLLQTWGDVDSKQAKKPISGKLQGNLEESLNSKSNNLSAGSAEQISNQNNLSGTDDVYKHLSEAITDLLGSQPEINKEPLKQENSNQAKEIKDDKSNASKSFDKLRAIQNPSLSSSDFSESNEANAADTETESVLEENAVKLNAEQNLNSSAILAASELVDTNSIVNEVSFDSESTDFDDSDVITGDPVAIFSSAEMMPSKLDDFQEPKVVMNEMASLMSKLESQVARAAKKLAARASEVEKSLSSNLDILLTAITTEDKDSYAELVVRIDVLSKQFESLFDNLKTELAEKAANSREQVKSKLATYQERIDGTENEQRENLIEEFTENKIEFADLVKEQEDELNKLIDIQTEVLDERLETVEQILEEASLALGAQLDVQFAGFKDRAEDRVLALFKTFDHHLDSLNKDIDRCRCEGIEKLNLIKNEFFGKLERLVQITEIDLSRQVRKAQTEAFLPRLKERNSRSDDARNDTNFR